jgi:3-isopropylmalate dehydratase small subunit
VLTGRVWRVGDNVPTDAIVRSDLVFGSMAEMVAHALEHVNPRFPAEVRPGDVLVAGRHFGQSSGRAIAARVLKAAGVACVVAETFARTFYRNGFEIGLPLLECPGVTGLVEETWPRGVGLVRRSEAQARSAPEPWPGFGSTPGLTGSSNSSTTGKPPASCAPSSG